MIFFKRLFRGKKKPLIDDSPKEPKEYALKVYDENGNEEDELTVAAINECYRTGKPVIAERDGKGNIIFK